ncbi:hypothetical protein CRYUN_Cryun14cG0098700 [Craigia yunnanensis]
MAKVGIPLLFLFSMFFLALANKLPLMPVQISQPRPLCATQLALLNNACAKVPLVPLPPPSTTTPPALPSPLPPESGNRNGHRHGHRHGHGHRHERQETPEQRSCCRWLKAVDVDCVCNILVHLPAFLSRPNHRYTVVVDETCSFTYSCGGRPNP